MIEDVYKHLHHPWKKIRIECYKVKNKIFLKSFEIHRYLTIWL